MPQWEDAAVADDPPVQSHLGAYALCVDEAGRVLLARMCTGPDRGRWTLPGGGVEPGEHPDHAVLRELHEETGLTSPAPGPVLGIFSTVYERSTMRPGGPVHHVGIVYDVRAVDLDGTLTHEQDGSTDRCAWHGPTEAAHLPLVPLATFGLQLAWGRAPTPLPPN